MSLQQLDRPAVTEPTEDVIDRLTDVLARHSIDLLRMAMGVVFLAFGVLKYIPGASPAESLVTRTVDTLTFGVVSGTTAMVLAATIECFIGLTMLTGKYLKAGLVVLAGATVGFMAPLVLFFSDMFPDYPTLEAQYIIKDLILAAAGLVIGAQALGARLVRK